MKRWGLSRQRAVRENAVVYWGDETVVSSCETVERGYAHKGQPHALPVETKRERVNMLSAVSSEGSVRFMVYRESMDQRLIRFMQRLTGTSERKAFLVLDNLKVHHGKLVSAWLEKRKDKIEVFFLPPYAPEYDPDEYLDHALKLYVHTGKLPYTAQDISHEIYSFMRGLQHKPLKISRLSFLL